MKRRLKRIVVCILALLLLFTLVGCGGSNGEAAKPDKPIKIIFGNVSAEEHPLTQGMYVFESTLEQISGGRFEVEIFPNSQLGSSGDMLQNVQAGNIQMCECSPSNLASFTDQAVIIGLPFLIPNRDVAFKLIEGELGDEMVVAIREETGIYVVGFEENGIRQFSNSKRPITKLEDMKGLKFRVMESPIYIKTFESLGAVATPMAFSELYAALQQGTVDGQDNPFNIDVDQKFYEVNKYMTKIDYQFDFTFIYMNSDFYDGLTEEEQGWVDEAVLACETTSRKLAIEQEQAYLDVLYENSEVNTVAEAERERFREACTPVYDWYIKEYNDGERLARWQEEIARLSAN